MTISRKGFGLKSGSRKALGMHTVERRSIEEIANDVVAVSRLIHRPPTGGVVAYNDKEKHIWWTTDIPDDTAKVWFSSEEDIRKIFEDIPEITKVTIKAKELPMDKKNANELAPGWKAIIAPNEPLKTSLDGRLRDLLVPTLQTQQHYGVGGYSHFIPRCILNEKTGELIILTLADPQSNAISGAARFKKALTKLAPDICSALDEINSVKIEDWAVYATSGPPEGYKIIDPRVVANF